MPFQDHRDFMETLKKTGDLIEVTREVDWDLEAGAISRRMYEKGGPSIWFKKIKDYPEGFTLYNGSQGTWRRVAISMGLPPETSIREIYRIYEERLKNPVDPAIVDKKKAPCKENVLLGDQVDLYRFPAPMIHEGDGGRYIGSWDLVVTKDPETGWTNWGMYRFMIHNRRWLAGWPQPTSQLAHQMKKYYLPRKEPMPVALVIGTDPLAHMVATAPVRLGEDEGRIAGALRGKPIDLVPCETCDLLVPAHSEIVIEGEIPTDQIVPDGPFGEYPGYRSGTMAEGVGFRVKAITFRKNPILTMIALGVPIDDSSIAASLTAGIAMKMGLKHRGIPVVDIYVPPEGVTHLIFVSVKKGGTQATREVLDYFTARRVMVSKVIVLDDDVDVFDNGQVLHAFATKCHPGRGILVEHYEGRANSLTPCYSPKERARLKGASVAFDATWPPEWPGEIVPVKASFKTIYSKDIQEKVTKNWKSYGFQ
jgi:phenylphosphate carboxylase alpha subunit